MKKISEERSVFRKLIAIVVPIFFFVVGIFLVFFGLDLISHTESSMDPSYGMMLLPIGIVITLVAVIGCIISLVNSRRRKK